MISVCRKRKNLCSTTETKIQSVLSQKHTLIGNAKARNTCGSQVEDAWECITSEVIANLTLLLQRFRNKQYTLDETKEMYKAILEERLEQLKARYTYSALTSTEEKDMLENQDLVEDCWLIVDDDEPLSLEDVIKVVKIRKETKKLLKLAVLDDYDKGILQNLFKLTETVLSRDAENKKELMAKQRLEKKMARKQAAKTKKSKP